MKQIWSETQTVKFLRSLAFAAVYLVTASAVVGQDQWGQKRLTVNEIEQLKTDAKNGDAEKQWALGVSYEFGNGVPQSYLHAHVWYNLASSQRWEYQTWRADIESRMTVDDVSKAQAMAIECMSSDYKNCGDY